MVDRLVREYSGKVDMKVYVDDTDAEGDAIARLVGVQYVPTFVFVNSDGSVSKVDVGALDEATMRSRLDSLK